MRMTVKILCIKAMITKGIMKKMKIRIILVRLIYKLRKKFKQRKKMIRRSNIK